MSKSENQVCLKYFGHLAQDRNESSVTIALSNSPQVVFLSGVETPCMAYFTGNHGVVCYINDGDANAYARHQFTQKTVCL